MDRQLNTTVYVADEDGVTHGFGPGDTVPGWARDQITNPDVWADDAHDEPDSGGPPPTTGKGSGLQHWLAHAESIGVDVPDGASRDEVIALVEANN